MGYSNTTNFFLYYDPNTHKKNQINHAYVDRRDIQIHPKYPLTPGSLLIQYYHIRKYTPYLPAMYSIKLIKPQMDIDNSPCDPSWSLTINI